MAHTVTGTWTPAAGNMNAAEGASPAASGHAPQPIVGVTLAPPRPPAHTEGTWTPGGTASEGGGPAAHTGAVAPRLPTSHVQGTWTPAVAEEEPAAPRTPATGAAIPEAPRTPATGAVIPEAPRTPATGAVIPEAPRTPATGAVIPEAPRTPATGAVIPEAPAVAEASGGADELQWEELPEGGGWRSAGASVRVGKLERQFVLNGVPGAWTLTAFTKGGLERGSSKSPSHVEDGAHAKAWAGGLIAGGWAGAEG